MSRTCMAKTTSSHFYFMSSEFVGSFCWDAQLTWRVKVTLMALHTLNVLASSAEVCWAPGCASAIPQWIYRPSQGLLWEPDWTAGWLYYILGSQRVYVTLSFQNFSVLPPLVLLLKDLSVFKVDLWPFAAQTFWCLCICVFATSLQS